MDFLMQGDVALAALLGLLIGSFLNVVIHRLPHMMEAQWDAECAEHQAAKAGAEYRPASPALTLCKPRSRCPHCGHAITWHENIPVLSWIFLRGKCRACKAAHQCALPSGRDHYRSSVCMVHSPLGLTYEAWAWCRL